MDRFIFSESERAKGACYHQLPVRRAGSGVERPDLYVACLDKTGYPCTPVLLCDVKLDNLIAAVWETTLCEPWK